MSARSELAPGRSALYQGAGFRRAARLVLAGLLCLLMIPAIVQGGFGVATAGALAGIVACVAGLWEARVRRVGIRIEPQGILAVYPVGHLRLPLEAVAGFSLLGRGSHGASRCVTLVLYNGERRLVPSASLARWGTFTGSHQRAAGGQTADVVAHLDDLLRRARQQAAAALTGAPSTPG